MSVAEQTAVLVEQLPPEQAKTVLEFARFLSEKTADAEWEKRLEIAHTLPKFREFIAQAEREISEGKSSPLDLEAL